MPGVLYGHLIHPSGTWDAVLGQSFALDMPMKNCLAGVCLFELFPGTLQYKMQALLSQTVLHHLQPLQCSQTPPNPNFLDFGKKSAPSPAFPAYSLAYPWLS